MLCPNCRNRFDTCGACWGTGYCSPEQYQEYLAQQVRQAEFDRQRELQQAEAARQRAEARANSPVPTTFLGKLFWLFGVPTSSR